MTSINLAAHLRQLEISPKSNACSVCEYANSCTAKDCRLIGIAANRLAEHGNAIETIKAMHAAASGVEKSLLRDVLSLFDRWYGQAPEPPRMVYDFELCSTKSSMIRCVNCINQNQWELISATAGPMGCTIFFRRPASE